MYLTVCLRAGYLIWESNALATKNKKSATKQTAETTKVTRITATDTEPKTKVSAKKTTKKVVAVDEPKVKEKATRANPLRAIGGYFAGAWYELRQVRWPNRKATWSLTAAVLGFTAFFVVLILLLDALFKYLFQLILG
jgi:preprotein translocase SecE subunit